jgi:hypothetical protein
MSDKKLYHEHPLHPFSGMERVDFCQPLSLTGLHAQQAGISPVKIYTLALLRRRR